MREPIYVLEDMLVQLKRIADALEAKAAESSDPVA